MYMNKIQKFYDKYADLWVNNPRYSIRNSYLNLLGDVRGKSIIDVGCGCGFDIAELTAKGAYGTGLDFSEQSIQIARERLGDRGNWNFVCGDFFTYIPEYEYDVVVFSMIIMHYADMNAVFKKLSQFIKHGGQLLLVTNNPYLVLMEYNLQYPVSGTSIAYTHRFVYNNKEILIEKYLHPFVSYFSMAKMNGLKIEGFQELVNYSEETKFFNPNPYSDIPNFLTFLYKKSI